MTMKTVRHSWPNFQLTACVGTESGKEFSTVTHETAADRWRVFFFWPMDFTFVCPTEIEEFGARHKDFTELQAAVFGVSTDTHFVHLAWRQQHPGIRSVPFPMVADTKRELSTELGILHSEDGVALRATYIVDPQGIIRHVTVNDLSAGRNVDETLRTLAALQTEQLTPCNWRPGQDTLSS